MKAITVHLDDSGLDSLLQRVRVAQEHGFDRFDLSIANPQAPLGRIATTLAGHRVSLATLRLIEPRHDAMVFRRPGYAKLGAPDPAIAERGADMVIETARQLAPLKAQHIVLDGGYVTGQELAERQAHLDELLDCDEGREACATAAGRIAKVDDAEAERQLEQLCRGLHRISSALEGLGICVVTPDSPLGLLQPPRMEYLLEDQKQVAYWHSTGNAALLQRLGGIEPGDWLKRFAPRLKGVYLSDMLGGHGDQPPGLGEVRFEEVASELASGTIRVMVVDDDRGTKLRFGRDYLAKVGIF